MTQPWFEIHARGQRKAEVLIYGDIGESWSDESITAKQFVDAIAKLDVEALDVRINSFGGSVPDALAMFNALRRHRAAVTTHIDGMAASSASLVAMAGKTVSMASNAQLMIHAPWMATIGNAAEMRRRADILDKWATSMAGSYARPGGLTEEQALALLTDGKDHWYTAAEAKELGMIDIIAQPAQNVAAMANLRFQPPARPTGTQAAAAAPSKEPIMAQATQSTAAQNPAAAPVQPTPAAQSAVVAPQADPKKDPAIVAIELEAVRMQAVADEANRRRLISAKAAPFMQRPDIKAMTEKAIDDEKISVEVFSANLLSVLGRGSGPLGGGLIMTLEDESDKFRAGVTAGMLIRAGLVANDPTNEFRGYSLTELARASLQRKNVSIKGMDKMGVVAAAFTHGTSDFTNLLADVANKAMLRGYEDAAETFQRWTSVGTLPDFKAQKKVDLNTFPALGKVEPGAEYKYVTVGDRGETIQLATYGSLFSITRQAIINDDLDIFTRVPAKMGRAAIRTVGNLVYAVLTGNPNMSDGTALFHADHANLLTGAAISTTSVDAMDAAMAKQTDATGTTLNIVLAYVLVPRALMGLAMQTANSEFEVGATTRNNTTPNWMRGRFETIADARLDAASASNWYGAANPTQQDTIEVAYLDGNQAPTLEQQGGWTVDGVDFKVRIDAGVKALDWRGLAKNPN